MLKYQIIFDKGRCMRLTLEDYSKHFKMSKEMINSKLKAKKLNYIIENGITYIITANQNQPTQNKEIKTEDVPQTTKAIAKPRTTVATVLGLYQRENNQLKEKINILEAKIDKLIDDKEQMLRAERDKIEEIYSNKDTQLKNILELINSKLMLEKKDSTIHEVETVHKNEKIELKKDLELIELKDYLKTLDTKAYQRKIIKKRFSAARNNDVRILQQNGKLFLDFSKYDYSDLLSN